MEALGPLSRACAVVRIERLESGDGGESSGFDEYFNKDRKMVLQRDIFVSDENGVHSVKGFGLTLDSAKLADSRLFRGN